MVPGIRNLAAGILLCGLVFLTPRSEGALIAGSPALTGSVRLPEADGVTMGHTRIIRSILTPAELSAPLSFSVTLKMTDLAGLQARLAAGGRVSQEEMEARYLPKQSDYDRVASWLAAEGFTLTTRDRNHTTVSARGSVADAARAFGIRFARVAASDGEYTSAIDAPRVPPDLAPLILGVNGLQPQFRLRHVRTAGPPPQDQIAGGVYVTPDNINSAYHIPASATGAGQTIAIVGEGPILASDLTMFWSTTHVAQSATNVTTINVMGGPTNADPGSTDEADLDVQWAGAVAPGAQIRLYLANNVFDCFPVIMNDLPSFPTMRVISVSFGDTEGNEGPPATLAFFSQTAAQFAAAGVSVIASSGDSGSNPTPGSGAGGYSASNPLAVNFPASDPSVTGVGGTTINFTGNWGYQNEVVWSDLGSGSASAGGVSSVFSKPAWQVGGTVLTGQTMRCVPDVSAISTANVQGVASGLGVLVYVNGAPVGRAGTSVACPVWAGVAALINQTRAAAGNASIGLLNPQLYPLQGTSAFNDVTTGTNGAYSAAPGYDLCTGLGSPNVSSLLASLSGAAAPVHRLVNVSTRAQVQTGANIVIAGFVISGPGGSKNLLVRAVGPGLTAFGVAGVLAQPVLSVFDSASTLIATDTGWGNLPVAGTSGSGASFRMATAADMASVGAFALAQNSADSAMVLSLPAGAYTAQVSGVASSTGVALAEVYEVDTAAPQVLVNISARCFVGTSASVAISGFVVGGNGPAQLLIRGIGPGLAKFGVTGTLAQPSISLFDSTNVLIASNTGWGSSVVPGTSTSPVTFRMATAADMASVNAFALTPGSADAAMVVTVPPGQYTAQISGVSQSTGTCLAEVYQLSGP